MEIVCLVLDRLETKDLKTISSVNKKLRENALRQLALNKWGSLCFNLKDQIEDKDWYLYLLKFSSRVQLSTSSANHAAKFNDLICLILLERKGILPNTLGAYYAAGGGHIDILRWLEKRDILPTVDGANFAACCNQLASLKWLSRRDILPNVYGINVAAQREYNKILKWSKKRGIVPNIHKSIFGQQRK